MANNGSVYLHITTTGMSYLNSRRSKRRHQNSHKDFIPIGQCKRKIHCINMGLKRGRNERGTICRTNTMYKPYQKQPSLNNNGTSNILQIVIKYVYILNLPAKLKKCLFINTIRRPYPSGTKHTPKWN